MYISLVHIALGTRRPVAENEAERARRTWEWTFAVGPRSATRTASTGARSNTDGWQRSVADRRVHRRRHNARNVHRPKGHSTRAPVTPMYTYPTTRTASAPWPTTRRGALKQGEHVHQHNGTKICAEIRLHFSTSYVSPTLCVPFYYSVCAKRSDRRARHKASNKA